MEYCCTSKYLRDLYCGYCQVLAVFRPVGTAWTAPASTASTRSNNGTKVLSIFAVYGECEVYFDHLSVHRRVDNLIRIYCIQHSLYTDGPTNGRWSKLLSGEGTRVLRVLAVFREYMLQAFKISTGSALLIVRTLQPFQMFVVRVLLAVLGVLCCSSHTQYSQYLGLQYS